MRLRSHPFLPAFATSNPNMVYTRCNDMFETVVIECVRMWGFGARPLSSARTLEDIEHGLDFGFDITTVVNQYTYVCMSECPMSF